MSNFNIKGISMDGKTAVVTGANTGLGKETARELARAGARVILACRDRTRAEEAREDIVKDTKNENVVVKILDLGSLRDVKEFADDINATEDRVDLLVNNAGLLAKERRETVDGFEATFGVNHLGHFYLTNLLLDKIKTSVPSRIVIVSSIVHKSKGINFSDLQFKNGYKAMSAYRQSKTANILHCVQLAKLLQGTGVSVYSLHPGGIKATEIFRDYPTNSCYQRYLWGIVVPLLDTKVLSIREGATNILYCCMEPSVAEHSGKYYNKCKETRAKPHATDAETARKLWDVSVELCDYAMAAL